MWSDVAAQQPSIAVNSVVQRLTGGSRERVDYKWFVSIDLWIAYFS
jgi:hypothetical protein